MEIRRRDGRYRFTFGRFLLASAAIWMLMTPILGQTPVQKKARCVAFELYTRSSDAQAKENIDGIKEYLSGKSGVQLRIYDLDNDSNAVSRFQSIATAYKVAEPKLPFAYGLNKWSADAPNLETWKKRLDEMLRMEVFTRKGCSRCAKAKAFLPRFQKMYPGVQVEIYDVITDPQSNQRFSELAASQKIGGISFPGFWISKQLVIGFDSEQVTAQRLDGILKRWTFDCEISPTVSHRTKKDMFQSFSRISNGILPPSIFLTGYLEQLDQDDVSNQDDKPQQVVENEIQLPIGEEQGATLDGLPIDGLPVDGLPVDNVDKEEVEVPFLGRLSAKHLGMPVFTILIGLVDGFNPCAMWVLLFLLSVLINLQDRWKIFAVAGTFVLISGVAYFAFMAAWLNVFLLVGFLRWVQILLASLAILVGLVNVKDFFAFKKGFSFSIPESAKPGIYSRVRSIVMAESLLSAILGAMVLAILVNFIELLCTAGLPALYSQVLSLQNYPPWKNYLFLLLYILAYMLDDSLMVTIVIVTLGKRKLQENEGRWLKLFSGIVILLLGFVLLFRPEWIE